jgi:hypothetical protein
MRSMRSWLYSFFSSVCLTLGMRRRGIKYFLMSLPNRNAAKNQVKLSAIRFSRASNHRVKPRR